MYETIAGNLVTLTAEHAIVETGGIGYRVRIPRSTHDVLVGRQRSHLYTSLRFQNDQILLYGFGTLEEREVFERLCTVSGIGPGTAMTILSGISLEDFRTAVHQGQVKVLEAVKGIGRKTAQRIILELREVLVELAPQGKTRSPVLEDAVGALVTIGYTPAQAEMAVQSALEDIGPDADLEHTVRLATRLARA